MTISKEELSEKIAAHANAFWTHNNEPLLLSKLGPELTNEGIDYKSVLLNQGLGNFITNDISELKLVKHPTQFAKVGVLPADKEYSFDRKGIVLEKVPSDLDNIRTSRRAFYSFIEALSKLPAEEIQSVNIPARVIVRLLEGK